MEKKSVTKIASFVSRTLKLKLDCFLPVMGILSVVVTASLPPLPPHPLHSLEELCSHRGAIISPASGFIRNAAGVASG